MARRCDYPSPPIKELSIPRKRRVCSRFDARHHIRQAGSLGTRAKAERAVSVMAAGEDDTLGRRDPGRAIIMCLQIPNIFLA